MYYYNTIMTKSGMLEKKLWGTAKVVQDVNKTPQNGPDPRDPSFDRVVKKKKKIG